MQWDVEGMERGGGSACVGLRPFMSPVMAMWVPIMGMLVPMPSGMVVGVRALRCWGLISWLTEGSLFMLFILLSGGELEP